jgi:hypothetical protein
MLEGCISLQGAGLQPNTIRTLMLVKQRLCLTRTAVTKVLGHSLIHIHLLVLLATVFSSPYRPVVWPVPYRRRYWMHRMTYGTVRAIPIRPPWTVRWPALAVFVLYTDPLILLFPQWFISCRDVQLCSVSQESAHPQYLLNPPPFLWHDRNFRSPDSWMLRTNHHSAPYQVYKAHELFDG